MFSCFVLLVLLNVIFLLRIKEIIKVTPVDTILENATFIPKALRLKSIAKSKAVLKAPIVANLIF